MSYDPRARGPHPVGVQTAEVAKDGRRLTIELWYPASERHAGADREPGTRDAFVPHPGAPTTWQAAVRDASPRLGAFPLVVFCHELGGHRRQSTFLCTHLASHGYVVASADHAGTDTGAILELARRLRDGELSAPGPVLAGRAAALPGELRAVIDALFSGVARAVTRSLQRERVAAMGHGLGATAALAAAAGDPRILAAIALAPRGPEMAETAAIMASFEGGFGRVLPILALAAERDSLTPLSGVRELIRQLRAPARLAVIKNAGHYHACDQAELVHGLLADLPLPCVAGGAEGLAPYAELIPAERAYAAIRSLCLAHLDAFIRTREGAKESLAHALAGRAPAADEAVDVELG